MVRLLVQHPEIDVNLYCRPYSGTALYCAATYESLEMVKILLDHPKIDVNSPSSISGRTPLMVAALWGRTEVILSLLRHPKVDLRLKDKNDETAIDIACRNGHGEIVRILQEAMSSRGIEML
jgi:ankyrin repeat protein